MEIQFGQALATVKQPRNIRVILFVSAAIILAAALVLAGYVFYQIYMPVSRSTDIDVKFAVEKGRGVKEIGSELESQKLIRSAFWFEVYVWAKRESAYLQAGNYLLSPSFNIPDIASLITGGKVIRNEAQVTIPEGFTFQQIKNRLIDQGVASAKELGNEKASDFELQYKFLNGAPAGINLEGFLFPDTYRFNREIKKEDIVKKFLDNFDRKLTPELRQEFEKQNKSLYETLILASIVQQESQNIEEMKIIAGIFLNRIRMGMPLQSDATVNYITGKNMRQVSLEDAKIPNPYNTYMNKGLPPGPISNPGIDAIKAVLYPEPTDYLYFLHPVDKPAVFSKTAEEHAKNKAKWLR